MCTRPRRLLVVGIGLLSEEIVPRMVDRRWEHVEFPSVHQRHVPLCTADGGGRCDVFRSMTVSGFFQATSKAVSNRPAIEPRGPDKR